MDDDTMGFICTIVAVVALYFVATFIGSMLKHKFFYYRRDRFVVIWCTFVMLVRLTLDLPFVIASFTWETSTSSISIPASEYAMADSRWMGNDKQILALELSTVVIETSLAYLVIRGILYNTVYRHFCQTCLSTLQVYRAWLIFGPELLNGFADIDWSNFAHVVLLFFVYNIVWTLPPLLILYETYLDATTGIMRIITPYRSKSPIRSSGRTFSTFRNRKSNFWHD